MASAESEQSKGTEAIQLYDFYYSDRQAEVNEDIRSGEQGGENAPLPKYFIQGVEFTTMVKQGEKPPEGARAPYRLVHSGGAKKDVEYK